MRGNAWLPYLLSALCCAGSCAEKAPAKEKPKKLDTDNLAPMTANEREADYYRITDLTTPTGAVLEASSFASGPQGRLYIGTRRGDVFRVEGATASPAKPEYKLFASGMTEVFGLCERDGILHATQQGEITRLKDTRGRGTVDSYETLSDAWAWGGEHEYTFGSTPDRDGAIWTVHCLTGSYTSDRLFRGWALRHFPDGRSEAMCSGVRSPGGIGLNAAGDVFYTENQGTWNGACGLKHLKPGGFMGNPQSYRWYEAAPKMGAVPEKPTGGATGRVHIDAKRIPQLVPTAVVFPYKKMGQSASAIMLDATNGKFGPFAGQLFVADYTLSLVMRVDLEKVNGVYQGACFPFRQGFATGLVGGILTNDGQMFVGGSNRGWPSRGTATSALQRLEWNGKVPFEVLTMRIRRDGFELRFTKPVDAATAADVKNYVLTTYTHMYHAGYGSPELDVGAPRIVAAQVSADGLGVLLKVDALVPGHVHELHMAGVKDAGGEKLLHTAAYYTVNQIPE